MVLIAPAVDFTEVLMWQRFPTRRNASSSQTGVVDAPGRFWPSPLSHHPAADRGRAAITFILGGMIETGCPVRILQGVQDPDVPWHHAVELVSRLAQDDVVLTLVKDGDHRLSRPEDIERLLIGTWRSFECFVSEIVDEKCSFCLCSSPSPLGQPRQ